VSPEPQVPHADINALIEPAGYSYNPEIPVNTTAPDPQRDNILGMIFAIVMAIFLAGFIWVFTGSKAIALILTGVNFIILGGFALSDARRKKETDFHKDLSFRVGMLVFRIEIIVVLLIFLWRIASFNPEYLNLNTYLAAPPLLQILLLLLIILIGSILYPAFYEAVWPYSDDELREPSYREITLSCGIDRAFDLCMLSFSLLPANTITDADRDGRIIHAWMSSLRYGASEISFNLEMIDDRNTRVVIDSIRDIPRTGRRSGIARILTGQNERIATLLTTFLQDQVPSPITLSTGDTIPGIIPDGREPGLPVIALYGNYFYKNPFLAAGLSLIPGLGSGYNGKGIEGFLIAFGAWFGLFLWFIPGIAIWLYGIWYAYKTARDISLQRIPYRTADPIWMFLILLVPLAFLFVAYMILSVFHYPGMPGIVIAMIPLH
jgi:hypothetical protein